MGIGSRKFFWLKPGTTHTLKVRAFAGLSKSEWSEITVTTSGFQGMTWANWKKVIARPVFWNRTIVVTWNPIAEPLRMDFYRLFRKATTVPSAGELADNSTDSPYWIEDTGRKTRRVDHILGHNPDIVKEVTYYYWVWAFDKAGNPSAHYLGGSGPNTTPDSATFGKPNVPAIEEVEYEHQRVIKYLADATVRWKVSGDAEGYWLQRKMNASALWGPMVWVDHDESLSLQEATMGNYITGVKYDWRVKAVNVPVALVSDWSATYTEKIPYDNVAPDEVVGVNARRFLKGGLLKGEHIRVQWQRPALAILEQQIERYQIFRKIGTDTEATAYATDINNGVASAYDDMTQFQGTRFIDDDVQPLPEGAVVGFHWNADYNNGATLNDRKTGYNASGTVLGTLNGTATFTTAEAQDGTYALSILANGDYLAFSNTGGSFNSAEGFLDMYIWYDPNPVEGQRVFTAYTDANNYFELYYSVGRLFVNHRSAGSDNLTFTAWLGGAANMWVRIRARWDVANQILQVQILSNGWSTNGGGSLATFTSEPTELRLGSPANNVPTTEYYIDNFDLFNTYDPPADYEGTATQYYHYWIRSIDVANLKSQVSMNSGLSYDKVSFEKPPAPTGLNIVQNKILKLIWTRFSMFITWDSEPEAVWYRVAMRVKGPGQASFGPWIKSPFLDEARITEVDDDDLNGVPKYTVPFTVPKDTTVEYKVSAANAAGESWSSVQTEIINADDVGPTPITTLTGECYGAWLFGVKLWTNVWLKWNDHPWYEGIANYEVFFWYAGEWVSKGHVKPTWINGKKTYFWIPALPGSGGTHKFKVVATDGDDNTADSNIVEVPWQAWFDWTKRGGA